MSPARLLQLTGDALFLCGGIGALALALLAGGVREGVQALLLSVTSFASALHLGVSLMRAREARMLPIASALIACALAASFGVVAGGFAFFDALFLVLALCLPAHAALQSYRVSVTLALREGGRARRAPALAASVAGALAGVVAVCAGPRETLIPRGFLPLTHGTALWASLCAMALVLATAAGKGTRARVRVALALALPPLLAGAPLVLGSPVPADWALTGPPALLHALQLVALAALLEPRIARLHERAFDPAAYFAIALAVGVLLVVDVPLVGARVMAGDPTTMLLAVSGCVTLAHALLDVPLWSLRDPNLLRAAAESIAPAAHGRHLVSNARAALVSLPIALVLGVSVFEPAQTILLRRADETSVALARTLFPGDARIIAADVRAALEQEDFESARELLASSGPSVSVDLVRLGVLSCVRSVPDAADACFEKLPAAFSSDVELRALQVAALDARARYTAALTAARALYADRPGDPHALALLGAALARAEVREARDVLDRAFAALERTGETTAAEPLDPLLLRAAAWHAHIARVDGRRDEARRWVERAAKAVVAQDLADVGALVFIEAARLAEDAGDARKALDHWKVAVGAARDGDVPADEAEAYLGYDVLLARSNAPVTLRYACLIAADRALSRLPADADASVGRLRERVRATRRTLEGMLTDAERARVEGELEDSLNAALGLEYPGLAAGGADEAPPEDVESPGLVGGPPTDNNDAR